MLGAQREAVADRMGREGIEPSTTRGCRVKAPDPGRWALNRARPEEARALSAPDQGSRRFSPSALEEPGKGRGHGSWAGCRSPSIAPDTSRTAVQGLRIRSLPRRRNGSWNRSSLPSRGAKRGAGSGAREVHDHGHAPGEGRRRGCVLQAPEGRRAARRGRGRRLSRRPGGAGLVFGGPGARDSQGRDKCALFRVLELGQTKPAEEPQPAGTSGHSRSRTSAAAYCSASRMSSGSESG